MCKVNVFLMPTNGALCIMGQDIPYMVKATVRSRKGDTVHLLTMKVIKKEVKTMEEVLKKSKDMMLTEMPRDRCYDWIGVERWSLLPLVKPRERDRENHIKESMECNTMTKKLMNTFKNLHPMHVNFKRI